MLSGLSSKDIFLATRTGKRSTMSTTRTYNVVQNFLFTIQPSLAVDQLRNG